MRPSSQSTLSTWHEPADFVQHLERLARERPRDTALTALRAEAGEILETRLDYEDFAQRARAIAARLQRHFQPGERVLIMMDNDEHYAVSMFGCFYSGVIAVPVFPPESMRPQHLARLDSIARDASARGVLTVAGLLPLVSEGARQFGIDVVLAVDTIDPHEAEQWQPRRPADDEIAFLQYTSGSTGNPKGVMVTHGNLMANERAIRSVLSIGADDSFGVWAPLFHDMGLIGGLLQPFYSGIPCVLASPRFFLEKSVRWLQMISRHRVSLSGGPDFAFRLCLDRIKPSQCVELDLSCWRLAYTGSEPVRADTMTAFIERFSDHGFRADAVYPCYGLAEATLLVTGGQRGHGMTTAGFDGQAFARREVCPKPDGIVQVGCGAIAPEHQLRLARPDGEGWTASDQIGEIWVAGPSVAAGYWKNPEATAATFVQRDGQRWLRTGDLGFIHEGQLYLSGRQKDMIIVRGHNLFPQDIERVVEDEVEAVRKGRSAAFAVEVDGREGIGVAAEISRGLQKLIKPQALIEAIRIAVSEVFGESPSTIVLLNPGALPKTSSGKVQRSACQQGWQARSLDAYASEEAGRFWLATENSRPDGPEAPPDDEGPKEGGSPAGDVHDEQVPHGQESSSLADHQRLTALWNEALRRPADTVYRDEAHFLAEGGNSLAATLLAARMADTWQIEISLRAIAEAPRFGQQLVLIRQAKPLASTPQAPRIPLLDEARRCQPQPLTPAQRQQWFLWRMNPSSSAYHIQGALRLDGLIDIQRLEQAVQQLVSGHVILQTVFQRTPEGEPTQQVQPWMLPSLERHEVDRLPVAERQGRALAILRERHLEPFDLEKGPLLRVLLIRLSAQTHVLGLILHHIISDGSSIQILLDELGARYASLSAGPNLAEARESDAQVSYLDYVAWQALPEVQAGLADEARYWEEQLRVEAGEQQPVLMLPTDHPRPATAAYRAGQILQALPDTLKHALDALAQRLGCSRFVLMLAAFQALLHRYTGQSDIRVGVPVANRPNPALSGTIGLFVNSVVMRGHLDGRDSWETLIHQLNDTVLAAQTHQRYPFDQLVERLAPQRDLAHSPLFQVMFNQLGLDFRGLSESLNVGVQEIPLMPEHAQFELSLDVIEEAGGRTQLRFTYARELFETTTIERMAEHYLRLLKTMTEDPVRPLGEAPLLSDTELIGLTTWGENPAVPAERILPVHALFEAQADHAPHHDALVLGEQTLSYASLNQQANQLAHHLIRLGVKPEVRVGIAVERSIGMVVGLMAILKAGGAYVPLDPEYPAERLRYMIEDSGIGLLLTQTRVLPTLAELGLNTGSVSDAAVSADCSAGTVAGSLQAEATGHGRLDASTAPRVLDLDAVDVSRYPVSNPGVPVHGENLAYVIYTSGSTGRPKGVGIAHRCLIQHIRASIKSFALTSVDRVLQFASLSFDTFVEQLFGPLVAGGTVVLRDTQVWSSRAFLEALKRHRISVADLTPAYWLLLIHECAESAERDYGHLRQVSVGGEVMPAEGLKLWKKAGLSHVRLLNAYGPTEATITASTFDCTPYASGQKDLPLQIPIGRPLAGRSFHVVDDALNLVPQGVAGELLIGGHLLARGYLGRQDVTAERFVPNPFGTDGSRLYRTGDLVRWRADGQLEYLGRVDQQVKIRGFRVELGEVQATLLAQPEIREAAVVTDEGAGGARLAAYVSVAAGVVIEAASLRARLRRSLPDYMVPSVIMVLDVLPLNANGKVDRMALPVPDIVNSACEASQPPIGDLEERLASVWRDLLGVERVGRDQSFFDLGGTSLSILRLQTLIQPLSPRELTVLDLFRYPSIASLAAYIDQGGQKPDTRHEIVDSRQAALHRRRQMAQRLQQTKGVA